MTGRAALVRLVTVALGHSYGKPKGKKEKEREGKKEERRVEATPSAHAESSRPRHRLLLVMRPGYYLFPLVCARTRAPDKQTICPSKSDAATSMHLSFSCLLSTLVFLVHIFLSFVPRVLLL